MRTAPSLPASRHQGKTSVGRLTNQSTRIRVGLAHVVLTLLLGVNSACRSPYYADQGALVGGLTGAGVGAAIGNASGNTAAGAVLGSAVGALTGGAVGQGMDDIRAENQAMIDQRLAERAAGATTMHDVIRMSQAGLSDDVIANHVRTRGVAQPPSTADLITMKDQGVSDTVIRSMQEMAAVPPPPLARPVVVEEHYIAHPAPYWGPRYVHYGWHGPHRYARRPHPGVHWGVSVSN